MVDAKRFGGILKVIGRIGIVLMLWSIPNCGSNTGALKIGVGSDVPQPAAPLQYAIHAIAGRHGKIEPSGQIMVNLQDDIVFQFVPDDGYWVDSVVIDRSYSVGRPSEYTFTHVNADHTIEVFFKGPRAYTR